MCVFVHIRRLIHAGALVFTKYIQHVNAFEFYVIHALPFFDQALASAVTPFDSDLAF